jgi:DNA-binding MarR family transcriptional regulator
MTDTPARPAAPEAGARVLPLIEYLARVARRAYEAGHGLDAACLRPRHLIALSMLREHGALSQQALGEALSLDPSNVVGLLNDLEARGLITRQRDPADRRRHIVSLTPSGSAEVVTGSGQLTAVEDAVLSALSAAERAMLFDLLRRAADGAAVSCGKGAAACGEPPGC